VITGPHTRIEVSVLGRLDMCLTTREPPSCFTGAPTSAWHRSRPAHVLSQRFVQRHDSSRESRHTPVCRTPLRACSLLTISPASSCADRRGTSHAVKACAELSQPSKLRLQQRDIMVTRRLRAKPACRPSIAWITIKGIRPNTLTEMTVFKDSQDFLNALNEGSCTPPQRIIPVVVIR
jgi:hypothetical protein